MLGFDKTLCMIAILVVESGNTSNIKEIDEHMVKIAHLSS